MTSVYGYITVEPEEVADEELAETIERVENDLYEAKDWESGYASEVDRLQTLLQELKERRKHEGG